MSFQINVTPPKAGAKKLPHGLGVVITVGVAALAVGVGLNLWLGEKVGNPKFWFAATMVVALVTICLAAFRFHRDRDEDEHNKYIEKLRAIVKITHKFKVD